MAASMAGRVLRAATRGSPLARWQTDAVAAMLAVNGIDVVPIVVETLGDRDQVASLSAIGGQGVFVKEVQSAVLDGRADLAVHSAKDLMSTTEKGLVLAAVPERGDVRDALVGSTFEGIPTGGLVGTGSVRRRAQLAYLRPDLTFADLRGNIGTRLQRAGNYSAIVIAATALQRLGMAERITEALDASRFVPQVAQGALAVECRCDDEDVIAALAAIEDAPARAQVDAERAYQAELGGGCSLPAGANAVTAADGSLVLTAILASADGRLVLRHSASGAASDPPALGRRVASYLLDEAGGRSLLLA
jgi:hydroxymethylbilane synthase